jgi:hypothetical protein
MAQGRCRLLKLREPSKLIGHILIRRSRQSSVGHHVGAISQFFQNCTEHERCNEFGGIRKRSYEPRFQRRILSGPVSGSSIRATPTTSPVPLGNPLAVAV